jgi:pimeloyl-ACP methyl ester carboxylesterase
MPRQLEYYVYPRQAQSSSPERHGFPADFAVVMGTPVACLVRDMEGRDGNTGAHAAELAQRLGVPVVAYQDLGPKVSFPDLRQARYHMHPRNFPEYAAETAESLAENLAVHGIRRVAFRIHSGNGPLGTELARNFRDNPGGVIATHLAVSDPAGLKAVPSFHAGLRLWLDYRRGPEKLVPTEQRPNPEQPRNTFRSFAGDVAVRGLLWRTPVTLENLRAIRQDMPRTAVLLHVPGNTFNGTSEEMRQLASSLPDRESGAPFRAEYHAEDYHSTTYDSFAANEAFVRRTLALAPPEDC